MVDRDDDLKIGVKSTAVFFGERSGLAVGFFFALTIFFLCLVGQKAVMGPIYYGALILSAIRFLHQIVLIQKGPEREELFALFKSHVALGALILAGIVLDYHFKVL